MARSEALALPTFRRAGIVASEGEEEFIEAAPEGDPAGFTGAFAAEAIPARLKIGEVRGESLSVNEARIRATRSERIMIVEISSRKAIDFTRSSDPMRFTNHSCQPNARLCIRQGRVEFYAVRAIAIGEEITVDYGETHHEGKLPCRCGAPGCRGAL